MATFLISVPGVSASKFLGFSYMTLAYITFSWEERPPDEEQNSSGKNVSRKGIFKDTAWFYPYME